MLTGKNTQWGSKPAYQLTSNQMEGKSEERKGGSHRNRKSKENMGGRRGLGAATTKQLKIKNRDLRDILRRKSAKEK